MWIIKVHLFDVYFSLFCLFFFIIYAYARISFRPHFLLFLRVIKIFSSYRPSFHIAISSFHSAHLLFAVGIQLFHEGKIVVLLRKIFSTSGTQGNNNLRTHQCVINRGQNPQRFRLSFNFDIQSWDFYFSVPPPQNELINSTSNWLNINIQSRRDSKKYDWATDFKRIITYFLHFPPRNFSVSIEFAHSSALELK